MKLNKCYFAFVNQTRGEFWLIKTLPRAVWIKLFLIHFVKSIHNWVDFFWIVLGNLNFGFSCKVRKERKCWHQKFNKKHNNVQSGPLVKKVLQIICNEVVSRHLLLEAVGRKPEVYFFLKRHFDKYNFCIFILSYTNVKTQVKLNLFKKQNSQSPILLFLYAVMSEVALP